MVQALTTQGIDVSILGVEHQSAVISTEALYQSVTVYLKSLPLARAPHTVISLIFQMAKALQKEQPTIVHVNAIGDLLPLSLAVRVALPKGLRPKVVVMSHSPMTWRSARRKLVAGQLMKCFADGVVCLTQSNANEVLNLGIRKDRIAAIPNPYNADQNEYSNLQPCNRELSPRFIRIVYVASICRRKAQDVLIRAAHEVVRKHPDAQFYFVGKPMEGDDSYVRSLEVLTRDLAVSENVRFVGPLPFSQTLDLVASASLIAFPTSGEMMPRAVIEAMKLGKPVVASAVDGIVDLIEHGKTGLLVRSGEHHELAEAICSLIEDPAVRIRMGIAAEASVRQKCSPSMVGQQYRTFYNAILGSHN